MGYIAEKTDSMAIAMTVPLAAYLYVAWYSFRGSIAG
jgi:fucose permease